MSPLATVHSRREGDACVIAIRGEIDLSNTEEIAAEIAAAAPADAPAVHIDLSETGYLDSTGVRLLLTFAGRLQSRRQALRLRIPEGSPIRSTLEVAGLSGVIPIDTA